jgi:hypothetical protein
MAETVTPVPAKGTPEYDAYMVEVATKGGVEMTGKAASAGDPAPTEKPAAEPAKPAKPEWLPEKFWDADKGEVRAEALAKSYRELESARSKPAEQKPAGEPAPAPSLTDLLTRAQTEFASGGQLTDETYELLAKAGTPRETVDAYIEGQRARAELTKERVFGVAGGQETYSKMTAWAETNLSEAQIEAFNTAMDSGSLSAMTGAAANLRALYEAANGKSPSGRVESGGGAGSAPAPDAFRSSAEMKAAMADPRYRTDAAYRADVARKVEGAAKLGVNLLL